MPKPAFPFSPVMTVTAARKLSPSPWPEGLHTLLEKYSILNSVWDVLLRFP